MQSVIEQAKISMRWAGFHYLPWDCGFSVFSDSYVRTLIPNVTDIER